MPLERLVNYPYWWESLLAIPYDKAEARPYRRLERVFQDRTLKFRGDQHQLTSSDHETHFTVGLWENFSLFAANAWLPLLWRRAALQSFLGEVGDCHWSYEWVARIGRQERNLDVTLRYEDDAGAGILVVEAKKPGVSLKHEKDLQPIWYREVPEFQGYERFSFLYLVDAQAREEALPKIVADGLDVGFLTWEELAAVQIDCARRADLPPAVRAFLAASMHRQYCQLGVVPESPPLDYLVDEPSVADYLEGRASGLRGQDWSEPLWMG